MLLLVHGTKAQQYFLMDPGGSIPVEAKPYPDVEGSPYLTDFSLGTIIFSKNDTVSDWLIAFNTMSHTLVYEYEGKYREFKPGKILGFILDVDGEKQLYRSGFKIPEVKNDRFVEVLVDGDITLVAHKYKEIVDQVGVNYGSQSTKAFQSKEDLIVIKDGEAFIWRPRKKNLTDFFGEEVYENMNKLSSSNKLDLRKKADLKKLIQLMNAQ